MGGRSKGIVKVQLIYPKDKIGESGDVTVEDGSFRIPILFFTQSRAPFLNGSIPPEKCARKPKTIVVSLIANNREYDRVSLDMAKDFKKIEPSTYALRSEILLQGPGGTTRCGRTMDRDRSVPRVRRFAWPALLVRGAASTPQAPFPCSRRALLRPLYGETGCVPKHLPPSSGRQAAPHPAAKPDSSRPAYRTGLLVLHEWPIVPGRATTSVPMKSYAYY